MITPPVSWTDSQQHRWELHWYIWRWDVRTRVVLIRPTIDLDAILTAVDKARMCPDDAVPKQILYHKPQCWMCMLSSRRGRHTPQRAHGVCNQSRNAPCRRTGDTPAHLPSPFWRKVNTFRGLFEFLRSYVATIKLAYNENF